MRAIVGDLVALKGYYKWFLVTDASPSDGIIIVDELAWAGFGEKGNWKITFVRDSFNKDAKRLITDQSEIKGLIKADEFTFFDY